MKRKHWRLVFVGGGLGALGLAAGLVDTRTLPPAEIVAARGLGQISDSGALDQAVAEVIAAHPDAVEKIKGGNHNTVQFLMGQVMRATRGKANPQLVQDLLRQQLEL